jgi:Bardet-Biedl syndrome 9 protein
MSFQFSAGQEVSILVSKNAGRYRLQADCFQAMWLVLQELARRLTVHFDAAESKPGAAVRSQGDACGSGGAQQQQQQPFSISFEESLLLQVRLVLFGQKGQ